jgi:hypothetical protein
MHHVYDLHWLGHANALVTAGNEASVLMDLAGMKEASEKQK